jgi:exopolysaccharide biosynthesis protein
MIGTIIINGWRYAGKTFLGTILVIKDNRPVRAKVFAATYVSQEGWKAQEVYGGAANNLIGLMVVDEAGKRQGMVQGLQDLP